MWCRCGITVTAITLGLTATVASYEVVAFAQSQLYTPSQLRQAMRGLGYTIPTTGTQVTSATQKAVRDFQQHYGLKADGVPGTSTEQLLASVIKNLQGSLNLVVKPTPPLPRSQFYTPETAAVVKQFERQQGLPVTGIANLAVRSQLDRAAKKALGETSTPSTTPSPSMTPSMSPSESPSMSPMSPSMSPSVYPSTSPSMSPMSPSESPTVLPSASPSTSP